MRDLREFDKYRDTSKHVIEYFGEVGDHETGCFKMVVDRENFYVIAAASAEWEHVSVSHHNRTPTWGEMESIKRMFFKDNECVMQLHVPIKEHIDNYQFCLHLWRPRTVQIPRPPQDHI